MVKVTKLTASNVAALREMLDDDQERVTVGATVATFNMGREDALALVQSLMDRAAADRGTRGHPYQSLHAVRRKLHRADRP